MANGSRQSGERVFVALDPPAEVRAEVEAWTRFIARSRRGLRVVPARNSHITLAFLGQRDEYEIEQISGATEAACASADGSPTDLSGLALGAPAWLPKRRPRNLVLDIHDDRKELAALQGRLAGELRQRIGWQENRPYRPHLTCARTGRGFDPSGLRLPVSPAIAFNAEAVSVNISHLSPEGAEYEAVARFTFGLDRTR